MPAAGDHTHQQQQQQQQQQPSYLIVGAGVFGVSTAYHLIRAHPGASVTLVDRDAADAESRVAASWDWNKVVRADYDDLAYCRLALEAQDVFESDPLWKPYFHKTGVYWICRSDYAKEVMAHHRAAGRGDDIVAVPIDEAKKLYGGIFKDADYSGAKEVLVNRASGWAAAGDCLRAVTRRAVELGVRYVVAETAVLELDGRGGCRGVRTTDGRTLTADRTILCTGAYTPKLLELSAAATGVDALRSGDRILAAGITTGMAELDEEQDAFTTSSDFIISPHPAAKGLYVATCGSFHGFKFFPVLGKCVMQMLNGELTPELKQRWAWDRERPDYLKNPEYPNSDMRDLVDVVAKL
uniref:Sarcosine oxidase n=1 Tax=Pyricularia oryzae (strain P131) TaxID=1143193 RepID=L7IVU0_PYRO1